MQFQLLLHQGALWAAVFMVTTLGLCSVAVREAYFFSLSNIEEYVIPSWLDYLGYIWIAVAAVGWGVLALTVPQLFSRLGSLLWYRVSLTGVAVLGGAGLFLSFFFYYTMFGAFLEFFVYNFIAAIFLPPAWMAALILLKNTVFRSETGLAMGFGLLSK